MNGSKASRKYPVLFIILAGLMLVFSIRSYTGRLNPLFSDSDQAILLALQYKMNDPALYSGDQGIAVMAESYPKPVNWVMAKLLEVLSIQATYLVASLLLYVFFISGMYILALYLTNSTLFATFFTLQSIYGQKALNGIGWGIQLGHVLPRDLFIALSPLLFLAVLRWRDNWKKIYVLFFGLGILANVHFLSALYLACIFVAYLAVTNLHHWKRSQGSIVVFTFMCILLFIIGAVPYFLQYVAHPHPLLKELVQSRMPYLYEFPLKENALYLALPIILALLGYWHRRSKQRHSTLLRRVVEVEGRRLGNYDFRVPENAEHFHDAQKPEVECRVSKSARSSIGSSSMPPVSDRWFLTFMPGAEQMLTLLGCVALITGVGILVAPFLVNIAVLQFYRVSAFAYLPLFFFASMFLISLWQRTTLHKFIACFLLLITAIPAGLSLLQFFPQQPLTTKTVADSPVRHWNDFVEMSNWIEEHTPKQALFLVPPLGFESFRVTAQRGIVVSYKDGSTLILMDTDGGISWQQRYQDAQDAYAQGTPAVFNAAASKHHATYLLIDFTKNKLPAQPLFSNSQYAVYALPFS